MAAPKTGPTAKKVIDVEVVKKLAERGWSGRQIAAAFSVNESVIRKRFGALMTEARHHGAAKLLDVLWQRGVTEKDTRVLIHLADRILGVIPKKIEITKEQAIEVLEKELEREGTDSQSPDESEESE